jgi:hypothetical protein
VSGKQPPYDDIGLLQRILADAPLFADQDLPCKDDPQLWDSSRAEDIALAVSGCQVCPMLQQCARWALSRPDGDLIGTVGGEVFLSDIGDIDDADTLAAWQAERRRVRFKARRTIDDATWYGEFLKLKADGLTHAEVADQLGVSRDALQRRLKKLRRAS